MTAKEKAAARARKWRKDNPERARELSRNSYKKNGSHPSMVRARRQWHLKTTYGISLEDYERMFVEQGGVCAICHLPETGVRRGARKSLDVDHDHTTGKVRGLLCSACNASLGLLREDTERVISLLEYLVKHNGE